MLLELMLGIVVLVIGVGATLGSISSFAKLEQSNRDTTLANLSVRRVLENMQAESFPEVLALYNNDRADDPVGVVIPGSTFAVLGLSPQQTDADGIVGQIILPLAPDGTLRENLVDADFGLPRDLNGDGAIDGADHSADYLMLPVRVRVQWRGLSGNRAVEIQTTLVPR